MADKFPREPQRPRMVDDRRRKHLRVWYYEDKHGIEFYSDAAIGLGLAFVLTPSQMRAYLKRLDGKR